MKRKILCMMVVLLVAHPAWTSFLGTESEAVRKATHLLNRATFGPKPGEIDELARQGDAGISSWIENQLHPEKISDTQVETKLKQFPSLTMINAEISRAYPRPNRKEGEMMEMENSPRTILIELASQKFIRAIESNKEFQEVLVDFWYNHFNVDFTKGRDKWLVTTYERDAIRPYIFGNFFDLLKATAQNPAMLFYLDNFQSVKNGYKIQSPNEKKIEKAPKGLNENYARELMELHTLGVDGGYTQKDVIEVARILTGWTLDRGGKEGGTYHFNPEAHDMGAKKVLGMDFPAGGGEEEGIRLLRILSNHPATARHIATKLAVRFISDHPPASAIDALAKTFLDKHGNLTAVYRKLFELPEFWAADAQASKIKKPFHFVASSVRALNGTIRSGNQRGVHKIDLVLTQMGEPIYRCQPPTGFKETSEFWVNPGALVTRINTSLDIAHQRMPGVIIDMDFFRNQLEAKHIDNDHEALEYLNSWLLGGILQPGTRERISKELANAGPKVVEEIEPTIKIKTKTKIETANVAAKSVNLGQLLGLLLGSPEFQRY